MKLLSLPVLLLLGCRAVNSFPFPVDSDGHAASGEGVVDQTPILAGDADKQSSFKFHDHHPIPEGADPKYHETHPIDADAKPRFHDHHPIPEGADPKYHETHPVDADAKPRFHDHHPIREGADPNYHATHPVTVADDAVEDEVADEDEEGPFTIPSKHYSTILGRRLLGLSTTGVLTTVFPSEMSGKEYAHTPAGVNATPIGLPEYIASCEEDSSEEGNGNGNPTLLALRVSTSTKNALAGSNASLALSWWDEYSKRGARRPAWSQANLPRLSITGYLEEIPAETVVAAGIEACFTAVHRDSVMWLPGRKWAAHQGLWMRLVVREVYWIGGFGDRNYIGWFDRDDWAAITRDEWESVRLPGEDA